MRPFKTKYLIIVICFGVACLFSQCAKDFPILSLDEKIEALEIELQDMPSVVDPVDNPSTAKKRSLGKILFWDPIISGEKDIACASCHHPATGYADGLALSIGVGGQGLGPVRIEEPGGRIPRVGRGSPTIINAAYIGLKDHHQNYEAEMAPMFWDSRVLSLENQCLGPPTSFNEMAGDAYSSADALDSVMARLAANPEYVRLFDEAFGGGSAAVTITNFAKAVAAFERSIISVNSPYDQYIAGNNNALTDKQKEGLLLFFGKANCVLCHKGPNFSDYKLTVHGVKDNPAGNYPDRGGSSEFKFKTPTLRNIELTAPYTHGGMFETLEDALEFYNKGVSENPLVSQDMLDPHIEPINLNPKELKALIAFLKALTDDSFDKTVPANVPSGLNPGGNIY